MYPKGESFRMPDDVLEAYIVQHIDASPGREIRFSWHGGEPTTLGLNYFKKIVSLQRKHVPRKSRIINGMQTNGTLLNDEWCQFLSAEGFNVGLSLDGPEDIHNTYRLTKNQSPTHHLAIRGYHLLLKHKVPCDILCVVNACNVVYPIEVYRYFKQLNASYIGFLPLVERDPEAENGVSNRSVPPGALGAFYSAIFDEWKREDIGRVIVQNFEEVAKTAMNQEHALCIFRKTCGDIPVVEHNGDYYACDHFVDTDHHLGNITETPLVELLECSEQMSFGKAKWDTLPQYCRQCDVLEMCYGGCPKDRFCRTPDGEPGLNYLCEGYKRFFHHCRPFVTALSDQWQKQPLERRMSQEQATFKRPHAKIGRNDPCPCGSGRKYKKCCMNK